MSGPTLHEVNRSRQHDLFRPDQASSPVTVIGVGGIGSPTVIQLAQMGVPDITVLDDDLVEEHNRSSQHYRQEDIGKPKVVAIAEQAASYGGVRIKARQERFTTQPLAGIVIAAVDSMDSRQAIWEAVRWNPNVELYIDGRMGGLVAHILTVRPHDPEDVERYEQHLFPQSEAAPEKCTARAIVFNTYGSASFIAANLRRWWVEGQITPEVKIDFGGLFML